MKIEWHHLYEAAEILHENGVVMAFNCWDYNDFPAGKSNMEELANILNEILKEVDSGQN